MGKTLKTIIIGIVVVVIAVYGGAIIGGALGAGGGAGGAAGISAAVGEVTFIGFTGAAAFGAAVAAGAIFGGVGLLLAPKSDLGDTLNRNRISVNPETPMVWAMGNTAIATDAVWAGLHGTGQKFYSLVVAGAAHSILGYSDTMYINGDNTAWTDQGTFEVAATGPYSGIVWIQKRIGDEPQAVLTNIDLDDNFVGSWYSSDAYGHGMTFYRMRWEVGSEKLTGGVPTRVVQEAECGPVYDPRLDTTVGGSGTHLANDQSTWEYSNGGVDIGANWALLVLRYLLGWRIGAEVAQADRMLVIGMGIDPADIDMDQAMAAANVCDATVPSDGEPRYHIGGVLPVTNDHEAIIGQLEAAINGKVAVVGGRYFIWAPNDDLAPFNSIEENDLIREAGVTYTPAGPLELLYNTARGRFINTLDKEYQLKTYPEVVEATARDTEDHGETRLANLDYPLIQSEKRAQRISIQYIRRSRFGAVWKFAMGPKGLLFQPFSVTRLNIRESYSAEVGDENGVLVRIINMDIALNGMVIMEVIEEDPSIYDTTKLLGTSMISSGGSTLLATDAIELTGLTVVESIFPGDGGTNSNGFTVSWDDPGAFVSQTQIQFKPVLNTTWIDAPPAHQGFLEGFIFPLENTTTYDVRARHVTIYGAVGTWVAVQQTSGSDKTLGGPTLLDSSWWVQPPVDGMGEWTLTNGAVSSTTILFDEIGPFGNLPKVMQIDGANPVINEWFAKWVHNMGTEEGSPYVVYCWVKKRTATTDPGFYMAWHGVTQELGTYIDQNFTWPIFGDAVTLTEGKWYLTVSYLHSSNYTGADTGICGVYDPVTGTRIYNGREYRIKPGAGVPPWGFGYFTQIAQAAGDGYFFTRPVAYKVDGSEPTIESALNLAAVEGLSTYIGTVYLRKATTPGALVTDDGSYTFETDTLVPPTISPVGGPFDAWSITVPDVDGNPLYIAQGQFQIQGLIGTDQSVVWSDVRKINIDGAGTYLASVFLRAPLLPATPTANSGSYDFTNQILVPPSAPVQWYTDIPDGTDVLFVSNGAFAQPEALPHVQGNVTWTAPVALTSDGANFVPDFGDGAVGGASNFIFSPNRNAVGASVGDIHITAIGTPPAPKFYHPDLTEVIMSATEHTIYTAFDGTNVGRFFVMFTAVAAETRFGGTIKADWGSNDTRFITVQHNDTDGWQAIESDGTPHNFTPNAGTYKDCIIARGDKWQLSGGMQSLIALTSGIQGDSAISYYIKPTAGTFIRNTIGILDIEAHKIEGSIDTLLTSGDVKMYVPGDLLTIFPQAQVGSTAYKAQFDTGDITDNLLIELKDISGTPIIYDTISLADILDGGISGFVTADPTLAWTRANDQSTWTPLSTTTDLDVEFWKTRVPHARAAVRVTRTAAGILTASDIGDIPHASGDYQASRVTRTLSGSGTSSITVTFIYDDTVDETSISETVTASLSGHHGVSADLDNPSPTIPTDLEGFNYTLSGSVVAGTEGTFVVNKGGVAQSGGDEFIQSGADGWTTTGQVRTKTVSGLIFEIDIDTGAYQCKVSATNAYRAWTGNATSVTLQAEVDTVLYQRQFTVSKAKGGFSDSVRVDIRPWGYTFLTNHIGGFYMNNSGYQQYATNTGPTWTNLQLWLLSGTAGEYEMMMTHISGDVPDFNSTMDVWNAMNTTRYAYYSGGSAKAGTLNVTIRRISDDTVVFSGIVQITTANDPA